MKIRMLVEMSGSRNGRPWPRHGEVADLPTGEAQHLVASGIAVNVPDETPPVEEATPPVAEASRRPTSEAPKRPSAEKRGRGRPRKTEG